MYTWSSRSANWASTGLVPNAARGQLNFFFCFLAPPAPEKLVSRDRFGVPSRANALIHSTPRLNPPPPCLPLSATGRLQRLQSTPSSVIGSVPSPSGHATAHQRSFHRRDSPGTGLIALNVARVTGASCIQYFFLYIGRTINLLIGYYQ